MLKIIQTIYLIRSIVWGIGFTALALIFLAAIIYSFVAVFLQKHNIPQSLWRRR